ncbi:hypothetical protein G7046_g389 [Stylonectria norvegica]|nr:hypothetical protein G7046_g389 [Stylonectria norvegica]
MGVRHLRLPRQRPTAPTPKPIARPKKLQRPQTVPQLPWDHRSDSSTAAKRGRIDANRGRRSSPQGLPERSQRGHTTIRLSLASTNQALDLVPRVVHGQDSWLIDSRDAKGSAKGSAQRHALGRASPQHGWKTPPAQASNCR